MFFGRHASLTAFGGSARADEPIRRSPSASILPQPAGGAVDLIARSLADRLGESMRQPVIVENQPGANGGLAAGQVTRSTPDGYTLFMAVDTNLVVNPSLYPNLTYDPFRDFIPISIIAKVYLVLVASSKVEANSVHELLTFASANPGKLNYASIGLGTAGASRHGTVQVDDQDRYHPGVLSWHRAGDDRHCRRRRRRHVHGAAFGHGAGDRRQGEDAGGRLAARARA